jgi:hypothetical protein
VVEQVGFVDHEDGGAAAFGLLDRECVDGLGDEGGVVGQRSVPEGGDDLVVDAADPDRRVGQVDDGVPGRVQSGERGADGDGLPGADLAGDHPDAVLAHAPADPGDGLPVRRVAVQHPGGEVAPERGAGEPEEPLQAVDHNVTSSVVGASVSRSSCPGIWSFVLVGAVLSAGVLPARAA